MDAVADLCGISRGFLGKIEQGLKLPSIETTRELARVLDLNERRLLLSRLNASMPEGFIVVHESGETFSTSSEQHTRIRVSR